MGYSWFNWDYLKDEYERIKPIWWNEHMNAVPLGDFPEQPPFSPLGGAASDWSSIMTDLHKSLTRAEENLRLIGVNDKFRSQALCHLFVAKHTLFQLERWCHGKH